MTTLTRTKTTLTRTNLAAVLAKLKIPKAKRGKKKQTDVHLFDDKLSGFGVRKFKSGKASFFVKFQVGNRQRKMSLGPATPAQLGKARDAAADIIAKARIGEDAQAHKQARRSTATVGNLVPRYLEHRVDDMAADYHSDTTRYLSVVFKELHPFAVDMVERADVVRILDDAAKERGKVAADRAKAALSGFFSWAIERGYADQSPVLHIKARANGGARERVLSESELVQVWRAVEGTGDYGQILRLLILTGQRRGEIANMGWDEVDDKAWQINLPGARTKNGRPHVVPLSARAMTLLWNQPRRTGSEFVFGEGREGFSGWSKAKGRLDAKLPDLEPWTLHDIRRSVVTALAENGLAQPHEIEAIVNHVSGHKAGIAGIYNRAAYMPERTKALDDWATHLAGLLAKKARKVKVA